MVILQPSSPPPQPLRWISFNKSEAIKSVALAFCSIHQHSIGDIGAKVCIPNLPQPPDIRQNSDEGISDFRNSCQSLKKINCHNSRTSGDTEMKLGPVTKINKRDKTT